MKPTGNCFDNCARALMDWEPGGMTEFPILVHAICTGSGPIEGVEFSHAFLLLNESVVLDLTTEKTILLEKDEYYSQGNVREVARYTKTQLLEELQKHRHWGPWHPDFNGLP